MKKKQLSLSTCSGLGGLCSSIPNKICSDIWALPEKVYRANNGKGLYLTGEAGDLNSITLESLNYQLTRAQKRKLKRGELLIYTSGSPCPGVSRLNPNAYAWDHRNLLMLQQIRLCKELLPSVCVFEQVPGFFDERIKPFSKHFFAILHKELSADYYFDLRRLNAKYYGANQDRNRLIFMFVRKDVGTLPSYPAPSDVVAAQYLSNLLPGVIKYNSGKSWQSAQQVVGTITRGSVKLAFSNSNIENMTISQRQLICGVEHLNLDLEGISMSDKAEMLGNMVPKQFGDAIMKHVFTNILKIPL